MNKTQLLSALAEKTGETKANAETFLDILAGIVTEALKTDGDVTIPGVARLSVKEKPASPAKQMRNPFTKQMMDVAAKPASKKVVAKPAPTLKKEFV